MDDKKATQLAPLYTDLRRSLVDAASWCAERFDAKRPAWSLRTPDLAPRPLSHSYADSVGAVVHSRSQFMRSVTPPGVLPAGRLMVYFPDADLCDGAAMVETDGYLDTYNCPPHDSWVALFRDDPARPDDDYATYLVAWVPDAIVARVSRGIHVNPEECIGWLDDRQVAARKLFG
ncbi:MAG: hypothetical protein H6738_24900 [Alphaproteobacteria bacterium]|nr:hypothetical protein [Alphaproteobacteria bacterium]MCB9700050.1 hypothetical protein [Alphaproteobacteria bacterium]